jgi:hypothetical protein
MTIEIVHKRSITVFFRSLISPSDHGFFLFIFLFLLVLTILHDLFAIFSKIFDTFSVALLTSSEVVLLTPYKIYFPIITMKISIYTEIA